MIGAVGVIGKVPEALSAGLVSQVSLPLFFGRRALEARLPSLKGISPCDTPLFSYYCLCPFLQAKPALLKFCPHLQGADGSKFTRPAILLLSPKTEILISTYKKIGVCFFYMFKKFETPPTTIWTNRSGSISAMFESTSPPKTISPPRATRCLKTSDTRESSRSTSVTESLPASPRHTHG